MKPGRGAWFTALSIQRLDHLLAEPRYLEATERTLKAAWAHIQEMPHAHASLLEALDEHLQPPQMVIVRGTDCGMVQDRKGIGLVRVEKARRGH